MAMIMMNYVIKFFQNLFRKCVHLQNQNSIWSFDESGTFVVSKTQTGLVNFLYRDSYVHITQSYKAINTKEAKKIAKNEIILQSPFEETHSIFGVHQKGENEYVAEFYFIDKKRVATNNHLIHVPWHLLVNKISHNANANANQLKHIFGTDVFTKNEGLVTFIPTQSTRHNIDYDTQIISLSVLDIKKYMLKTIFSSEIFNFTGWINLEFKNSFPKLKPELFVLPALATVAFIFFQSLTLIFIQKSFDSTIDKTSNLRAQYSELKSLYFSNLERYDEYNSKIKSIKRVHLITEVLSGYSENLQISTIDFSGKELVIIASARDVQGFIDFLNNSSYVSDIKFSQPITPGKSDTFKFGLSMTVNFNV